MKKIIIACIFSFCSLWGYSQQLTLEECCDIAAANNKQGKLADFSIQKAQLQLKNMNSNFLPKLSAAGGYLYADKDFGAELMPSVAAELNLNNTYTGGVQIEQPLFLGGKLFAARKMAQTGLSIAGLNKEKTESDIRFETEKAYWNVVKAKELQKVSQQFLQTVDELYRTVENYYSTGMASQNELLKVKVKINEAKLSLKRSENSVRLAKMSLCHLMGMPMNKDIDVINNLSDIKVVDTNIHSVENRLEYKILSENIQLKNQEIKAVRSDFLPRVGLVAGYNYMNGVKLNGTKLISDDVFAVMVSVKVPLFHWGEGMRKVKSAQIEKQMAIVQRDEFTEKMQLEVSQALNMLDESELEIKLTESAFNEATESLRESRKNYETGMETLVNYMDTQSIWQKSWAEFVSAKINYQIAKANYFKTTGYK
ncbi:TolC family protein [uncultured Bacteroides sp.]|uniref:TolC family protein n=1 Tax=uncultured Bacteroides sp. TaxID=162156 RepID=UPI00263993D0|nr:TolC family protein [uncultured Bacteroides sp.]